MSGSAEERVADHAPSVGESADASPSEWGGVLRNLENMRGKGRSILTGPEPPGDGRDAQF